MKTTMNLILAAAAAMALLAAGTLLEGPSDDDMARATATDLQDAKADAHRAAKERTIEEIMHSYAQLAGGKQ